MLEFDAEAECMVRGNELIIRPAKAHAREEFAEQIPADFIAQGYSGKELPSILKKAQSQVRPAVEAMIGESERVAILKSEYESCEDVFGGKENK